MHGTSNERVGVCHDRVGIIFFCGMWGSVWSYPWILQVVNVIPRPGVPRHIYFIVALAKIRYCKIFKDKIKPIYISKYFLSRCVPRRRVAGPVVREEPLSRLAGGQPPP